jgi:hypothetical protein
MRETWLKPNRRAIAFGLAPPLTVAGIGLWILRARGADRGAGWQWLGIAMAAAGILLVIMLLRQLVRPRIAYEEGHLLIYLRDGGPISVPVNVVEAFFLGQGPVTLPGGIAEREEAVNLVARLSQRHAEWARQEVKPALGKWCEGYVTIRGAWCERLDGELIRRLNRRLKEVKSQTEEATTAR